MFFYGDDFTKYTFVLRWFCPIYVLSFFGYPLAAGLRALEKTRVIFVSLLVMSVISVFSAKLFIDLWQLHGVMIGLMMIKIGMISFFSYDLLRNFSLEKNGIDD